MAMETTTAMATATAEETEEETVKATTGATGDKTVETIATTTKKTTTSTTTANTVDCLMTTMIAGRSKRTKIVDLAGGETTENDMARRHLMLCWDGSGRKLH